MLHIVAPAEMQHDQVSLDFQRNVEKTDVSQAVSLKIGSLICLESSSSPGDNLQELQYDQWCTRDANVRSRTRR